MFIITEKTIAKLHNVSPETASLALTRAWQIAQDVKHIDQSQIIADLFGLSMLFCNDCRDDGVWHIATKSCKGCRSWQCASHIEHRRCRDCNELQSLKSLLRKRR